MADGRYEPVAHDHDAFLARAMRRKGFAAAYAENAAAYELARELIAARAAAGLTQEQVAAAMGTTKSAVSRLEGLGGPSPSISTLQRYARAVGCEVEVRLVRMHATAEPRAEGGATENGDDTAVSA
jgi:DNA-binding XRE family transcriptional regulator